MRNREEIKKPQLEPGGLCMFLLLYRKAFDFCKLILYSVTLLKLQIVSRNFLLELLGTQISWNVLFYSQIWHIVLLGTLAPGLSDFQNFCLEICCCFDEFSLCVTCVFFTCRFKYILFVLLFSVSTIAYHREFFFSGPILCSESFLKVPSSFKTIELWKETKERFSGRNPTQITAQCTPVTTVTRNLYLSYELICDRGQACQILRC